MEITNINQLVNGTYTYSDYFLWNFEERGELFNGRIMKMGSSPAPIHFDLQFGKRRIHQQKTCSRLRNVAIHQFSRFEIFYGEFV